MRPIQPKARPPEEDGVPDDVEAGIGRGVQSQTLPSQRTRSILQQRDREEGVELQASRASQGHNSGIRGPEGPIDDDALAVPMTTTSPSSRKRVRRPDRNGPAGKRVRTSLQGLRTAVEQESDIREVLKVLDDEFAMRKQMSDEQKWCASIPHETKVSTVRTFYKAFHDTRTLPIRTCAICYRKWSDKELWKLRWDEWLRSCAPKGGTSPFGCRYCFPEGMLVPACVECARCLGRGVLSPAAQFHMRLGCEHMFPKELKELTPMEQKLIGLNSCYGFIATYSIPGKKKQTARYPRHVKGHITVFPNNVQELATKVLPHPLLQAMEEIHVSWHGPEKPAPKDLSGLLSVRRSVVERALVWLRENNPHYAGIVIDTREMDSWDSFADGVPSSVYDRMEHNEPSSWERTRTAHVVPPTERAMDDEESQDIEEMFDMFNQAQDPLGHRNRRAPEEDARGVAADDDGEFEEPATTVNEVTSSAMFALDRAPNVAEIDKLHFAINATQDPTRHGFAGARASIGSTLRDQGSDGDQTEPYIHIKRGDEFADSFDAAFFAKAFPALLPFGFGGPRLAEEATL
ncbi:hypothetical protein Purlil1_13611 [Purpureocillium lilacinum]|uniref:DUF6570 domain-containing protein n=1 Tax=Purpureocillium lilacinum TaxID=33203 RepID=A0ABR0BDJ6_PURLI|nr:hypothetical protein Purlil1_13611 [Purpureocillium lilacinum]